MIPGPVFASAPQRVYWEITRACDLACRHCRAEAAPDPDRDELSTAEGLALLERLARFGQPAPHLVLTGGDALKRPDLFLLIERARALGLSVSVAPSATPLLTAEAIRGLRAAGVEAISLSLDGASAASHDALRGVPGCFERTLEAARTARAEGLPFQVNTLVSRETLGDLPAIYDVVRGLGAQRWSLFFLISVGRGTVLAPISARECEDLFSWLAGLPAGDGPVVTTTEAPHFRRVLLQKRKGSTAGRHAAGIRDGNGIMFISHTGEITPSGFFPLPTGRVRRDDPVTVYRESPVFRALRRVDLFGGRCGRCEFRGVCGGSRARAYAASGDPLGEDPLCAYEPGTGGPDRAREVAEAGLPRRQ
ncbi:MAG: radical SAM/SPASM domain-containing protein [Candidatus Rokubacteria bacterium GWC2_70_16]|nr:MAG: radical SAM/SPASM domain-containing protein [Candidatus Rokubacteria bacterium GWC2_70_16]OGL13927.1 MAG: radical SAM/SPASM domain-containing protein [Candidatus Rokubacteria bacterium RIFCSPLOWO2_12_FULL_71_19]